MHRTQLYGVHVAAGARMVDFVGWNMPIHYGSQMDEHKAVRGDAGMFDVSHMTVVDIRGPQARDFLLRLLANDVSRLQVPGKALYSCMLNESGGVIDDLIAYYMDDDWYRLVVNAATRDKGLAWLAKNGMAYRISLTEHFELAMLAVQGPNARDRVHSLLPPDVVQGIASMPPFSAVLCCGFFIARTGYTGEDGYEVLLPAEEANTFWDRLAEAGVRPCGLAARDTLRLEAGMHLYGQDMDEDVTPLESGLAWTVSMQDERRFIGREALERQQENGIGRKLSGVLLEGRGVLRPGYRVMTAAGEGLTTSGTFSPTLEKAIALARVPVDAAGSCEVEIRGKTYPARLVKPPFVRHGKICDGII